MTPQHREIEARFLEINKEELIKKLSEVGATDLGEDFLEEVIFYDKDLKWKAEGKRFIRLRKNNNGTLLTYKHFTAESIDGAEEIEISVDSFEKAGILLDRMGFLAFRHQQKKRRSFELDGVKIDIDTWPQIPTYVELEGEKEENLKEVARQLNLDWEKVTFEGARAIIENHYSVPVGDMTWFTFDKFE